MTARPGVILVYSVLLVLALIILSAGLFAVAARETTIARVQVELLQARASAETAARRAAAEWSTGRFTDLAIGERRDASGRDPAAAVTVTRLAASLFLMEAVAEAGSGPGAEIGAPGAPRARAALLVRTVQAEDIPAAFPAAVTADRAAVLQAGRVSGAGACSRTELERPGVMAPEVLAEAAELAGSPPLLQQEPPALPDLLAGRTLADLADVVAEGTVAPAPVSTGGVCVPGPSNWGDTTHGRPCHPLLPVIHAPGDLRVEGGEGRGILVVDGDLLIEGDFTFHGTVIVRGTLGVGSSVSIRGGVRASTFELAGGSVEFDGCLLRTVLDAPALQRALRPGGRWWLPAF